MDGERRDSNLHGVVLLWKVSTGVPGKPNPSMPTHSLRDRDISMKAHYIQAIYYFHKSSVDSFCNGKLKEGLVQSVMEYTPAAGRFDLGPDGTLYIKCNDAGVRIFEAFANVRLEDYKDLMDCCLESQLSFSQMNGSEVGASPLVIIQITRFNCGGVAIGLSWSHVLGGALKASQFMRAWAECCRKTSRPCPPTCGCANSLEKLLQQSSFPTPKLTPMDIVMNMPNEDTTMEVASFRLSDAMVQHLISDSQVSKHSKPVTPFVAISAFVWRSILKAHGGGGPHRVLIWRESGNVMDSNVAPFHVGNDQILSQVQLCDDEGEELGSTVSLWKIANLIQNADQMLSMSEDNATLVYGHDLTFVNWEEVPWYDMQLGKGGPVHVSCKAEPGGPKGMVIVMPHPPASEGVNARLVKICLSKKEVLKLKEDLFQYSL